MKPLYRLTVNNKPVNIDSRELIELTLTDNRAFEADQLNITIADPLNTIAIPRKGAVITCALGWRIAGKDRVVDKGRFIVDSTRYNINPRSLTISASSANFRAGLNTVGTRSFSDKTLGDIVSTYAKKHKLTPVISDDMAAMAIAHIDQNNESDGHFLTRLARQYDSLLSIKSDRLLLLPMSRANTATGGSLAAINLKINELTDAEYSEGDRNAEFSGAAARWHNTGTGKMQWETEGKGEKLQKLKKRYPGRTEARRAAQAAYQRQQRDGQSISLSTAIGRPEWLTETPVTITGIKQAIDNKRWVTAKVTHNISGNGYTTSAELEPLLQ